MRIVLDTCVCNLFLIPSVMEENFMMSFSAFLVAAKLVNSYQIYPIHGIEITLFCNSSPLNIYIQIMLHHPLYSVIQLRTPLVPYFLIGCAF